MSDSRLPLVTRSRLVKDLRALGLRPGQVVMLHASVKAIGWIVGGPDMVLQAVLDVLTPTGTLMMMVSWEESTYELAQWPEEKRRAYLEECPPFDPDRSRACRRFSILTEYLRTWPGACRSAHPDASFAAVGKLAEWITRDHPLHYGMGPGSPLAKLIEAGGQVLLLGSPLECLTLLHHAEHLARVPDKPVVRYRAPLGPWEGEDYFRVIAREFLASGQGGSGKVGAAQSYLFDAASLNRFAIAWLERTFGEREPGG